MVSMIASWLVTFKFRNHEDSLLAVLRQKVIEPLAHCHQPFGDKTCARWVVDARYPVRPFRRNQAPFPIGKRNQKMGGIRFSAKQWKYSKGLPTQWVRGVRDLNA